MSKYVIVSDESIRDTINQMKFAKSDDGTLYDVTGGAAETNLSNVKRNLERWCNVNRLDIDLFGIYKAKGILAYEVGERVA